MLMNTVLVVGAVTTLLTALHESAAVSESPIRSRWQKKHLTYAVLNSPSNIGKPLMRKLVARSLKQWARVSALKFTEVSPKKADIKISSVPRSHGDGDFDGPGGVLAHAFLPPIGIVHLDQDDRFTHLPPELTPQGMADLQNILVHELGHALGLDHNPDRNAVMYLFANRKRRLSSGDILSIQRAYGPSRKSRRRKP